MASLAENLPKIISTAAQSNLGILALLSVALSMLAYFFFAQASEKIKVGIFVILFLGTTAFGAAIFNAVPEKEAEAELEPKPTAIAPPTKKACETEYLKPPYTTEGDGRKSKNLTCPTGKIIVPGSAKCMNTAKVSEKISRQIASNTWYCEWDYQEPGRGLWVEMACQYPNCED